MRPTDPRERRALEPSGEAPLPRLVVALRAEARPIIERLGLEPVATRSAYPIFRGARAHLIVSGVGKLRAAAATAYLHASSGSLPGAPWINSGLAGHPSASPGEIFLAHKVIDEGSGRTWYPPLVFDPPVPTTTVRTFDAPDERYENTTELSDMEAAGFLATATEYTTRELVHVLKVVSDNRDTGVASVNPVRAAEWMAALVPELETLIERLEPLAREHARTFRDPPRFEEILARARFSATRARRLRELLRRWHALSPEREPPLEECPSTATAILARLEEEIARAAEAPDR